MQNYFENLKDAMKTLGPAKITGIAFLVLVVVGIPLSIVAVKSQENINQYAWHGNYSSHSTCDATKGFGVISVSFTNTESGGSSNDIHVIVKDVQTGASVDLGDVSPGKTQLGSIQTNRSTLNSGSVIFYLTWTHKSGSTTDTSTYSAIQCHAPTPTVTITPTPTKAPTPTPTPLASCNKGCTTNANCASGLICSSGLCRNPSCSTTTDCACKTPTPTNAPTPTPTPTVCAIPASVQNIKITCPNCTNQ